MKADTDQTLSITVRSIPFDDAVKLANLAKANDRSQAAEIRLAIKEHVSRGAK